MPFPLTIAGRLTYDLPPGDDGAGLADRLAQALRELELVPKVRSETALTVRRDYGRSYRHAALQGVDSIAIDLRVDGRGVEIRYTAQLWEMFAWSTFIALLVGGMATSGEGWRFGAVVALGPLLIFTGMYVAAFIRVPDLVRQAAETALDVGGRGARAPEAIAPPSPDSTGSLHDAVGERAHLPRTGA